MSQTRLRTFGGIGLLLLVAVGVAAATRRHWERWLVPHEAPATASEDHLAQATGEQPRVLELSRQARENLNLVSKPANLQEHWRSIQVPGVIVDRPGVSDRGVTSPAVGVVTRIHAFAGDVVAPGETLFTLRLFSEYLQNTQSELFKATRETQLIKEERDRLKDLAKSGSIAGSRIIELDQRVRRQDVLIQAYHQDLLTRGLTPDQIQQITEGKFISTVRVVAPPPVDEDPGDEDPVDEDPVDEDPVDGRAQPVSHGLPLTLVGPAGLVRRVALVQPAEPRGQKEHTDEQPDRTAQQDLDAPPAAAAIQDAAIQDGPIEQDGLIKQDGPIEQPLVYEVQELKVELGQQVQAGQLLSVLSNHQMLFIEGHAFKQEASALERAAQNGWTIDVEFAEDDSRSWPTLDQTFTIRHLSNMIDPDSRTFDFYIPLNNQSRSYEKDSRTFVVWRFRPGQRVRLHVPVEKLENVIVLPAAAVVREGPEAYVFRQNGDLFNRMPVHVLHEDRLHVVLAADGSVAPGSYLAQGSAASLNRVLKSQGSSGLPAGFHVHADGTVHGAH